MATKTANVAVEFAKKHLKVNLDFSPSSIEEIDRILAAIGPLLTDKDQPSSSETQEVRDYIVMFACYFGETVRRNLGGEWIALADDPITYAFCDLTIHFQDIVNAKCLKHDESTLVDLYESLSRISKEK